VNDKIDSGELDRRKQAARDKARSPLHSARRLTSRAAAFLTHAQLS